jgi:hypothetical protein
MPDTLPGGFCSVHVVATVPTKGDPSLFISCPPPQENIPELPSFHVIDSWIQSPSGHDSCVNVINSSSDAELTLKFTVCVLAIYRLFAAWNNIAIVAPIFYVVIVYAGNAVYVREEQETVSPAAIVKPFDILMSDADAATAQ